MNQRITEVRAGKVLKKEKYPGLFGGRYRFSPYMACGHSCIYCDGRFEKYRVKGDFDRDVVARVNVPELLEKELPRVREPGPVCISSGVSDPYQPVEEKLSLTRSALERLSRHDLPVVIHTKSSLVLRDLDILKRISDRSAATVMVSLTMGDDRIRSFLEPGASPVEERLNVIEQCRKNGIHAGILAMPFVPFLTDSRQSIQEFASASAKAGAEFALPGLLTLKEGRQKDFFFSSLEKSRPDLVESLMDLYSSSDRWGNPPECVAKTFREVVDRAWAAVELTQLIPHSVYREQFTLYDHFTILLRDMIHLYRRRGVPVKRLRNAAERFSRWTEDKRRFTARRRNLRYSVIDDYLRAVIHSGELDHILDNPRLAAFLTEVEAGSVFDYRKLELMKHPRS